VGVVQRIGDLLQDLDDSGGGQQAALRAQHLSQGLPFDVLHGQVVIAVTGARFQRAHDVGMAQPSRALALAFEALQVAFVMRQVRRQHLERHHRAGPRIQRAIDHGHAAAADLGLDTIGSDLVG